MAEEDHAASAPTLEPLPTAITFKKRSAKAKSNFRKKAATSRSIEIKDNSDSDSGSNFASSEDEESRRIKKRRKTAGVTASSSTSNRNKTHQFHGEDTGSATSRTQLLSGTEVNDATKSSNWFDEDHNQDDLSAKNLLGKPHAGTTPAVSDGTYRGVTNYQSFIQKNPNAPTKQVGPMKAPTNVRTITITDFSPDVCKDYKQTGFCGFGDSCKFLHLREDYKQGWELDRDWEISTKDKKLVGRTVASRGKITGSADGEVEDDDDELLENIPFACVICKKPYTDPIVTKCGHYFCEACALQRYRKTPSCAACGSSTGGVFNVAKKLSRLLERKRERDRKRRENEITEGEGSNEEGEEEASEE